ncbi:hypothetical protein F5J12DRAFT_865256 [Pisolithus orientalis]|uniref:uncharacterized protein n=1 Tax=Pisolithus orientalis TaxID=936130 RepID=UPI0022252B87|nr:uncharacterized protein F5J12DRAFT_865256 [Pisolithus orientalis]KAI5988677.1 hypothetical protein F5J12DRAFT_865256 [Pisolithus orientalis]
MRLYRISESDRELRESLDTLDAGHLLDQTIPLSEYFLDVPVLQGLCVVLQVSSDFNRSANNPPWRVNHSTEGGDPIKVARDTFVADIAAYSKTAKSQSRSKRSPSPSSDSKPSSFRDRQKTEKVQIACGRPRDVEEVIPVTLLHRVFAKFIDSCQTHTITEEDNNLVSELADAMSALYENEHQRVIALNVVLAKCQALQYVVDATMCVTVRDNLHPYVIAEFKNEATASNSDPYVQAVAYYLELTKGYAPTLSGCALPCLLLIIFGPYIVFAGAVWTLRPAVQILSSPLAFHYHSTDTNSQIAAARHMAAFREAVRSLERYYETLPSASELANTLSHPILFPHAICIKFVRSYSKAAHLHFASLGLAPRLRGFEELAGGWYMVIMDRLGIRGQLMTLHELKLVHGDVRDTNILVKTDDRTKVMIIDFDWAGKIDEVRYPPYVNYMEIWRPEGARDGNLIKADHDKEMLDAIITRKSKQE